MIKKLRLEHFCIGIIFSALFAGHSYANSSSEESIDIYTVGFSIHQDGKERIAYSETRLADGRASLVENGTTPHYLTGFTTTIRPDGSIQNDAIAQKVFLGDRVLLSLGPASTSPSQFMVLDVDYTLSELKSLGEFHGGDGVIQLPDVETFHHISNMVVALDSTYKLGSIKKANGSLVEISAKVHQEVNPKAPLEQPSIFH